MRQRRRCRTGPASRRCRWRSKARPGNARRSTSSTTSRTTCYQGDTALHVAAAASRTRLVRDLVAAGAGRRRPRTVAAHGRCTTPSTVGRARRTGTRPRRPTRSRTLLALGADPDAADKNGTVPLLRAVRNRCRDRGGGAAGRRCRPARTNGPARTRSTSPAWTTGRGGSGSPEAREQQARIVARSPPWRHPRGDAHGRSPTTRALRRRAAGRGARGWWSQRSATRSARSDAHAGSSHRLHLLQRIVGRGRRARPRCRRARSPAGTRCTPSRRG